MTVTTCPEFVCITVAIPPFPSGFDQRSTDASKPTRFLTNSETIFRCLESGQHKKQADDCRLSSDREALTE